MFIIFLLIVNNGNAALLFEIYPNILVSVITEIFGREQE